MTDRLNLPLRYRCILEALLREHVPNAEVWAYGSRVIGESHDGCDLDLVVRGPELKPLGDGFFQLVEAIEKSNIPILVQAHDWARLPESFHEEIEREYVVLQEGGGQQTMTGLWHCVALSEAPVEIVDGDRGKNYPKKHEFVGGGNCLFLNAGNVTADGFNFSTCFFVSLDVDQRLGKGKLIRNDVVLTTRGTVGNSAHFSHAVPHEHVRINSGMVILRAYETELHHRFLYFVSRSQYFQLQIQALSTGSAQPQLPIRDIEKIDIPIPPLSEQRDIAHILGTIDDKIELNRRMNETLEEMARALFKSWFVDFLPVRAKQRARTQTGDPVRAKAALKTSPAEASDWTVERASAYLDSMDKDIIDLFPDRFVDSELGEIPEGWEVGKLSDIVTRLTSNENPGLSPSTEFSHFSIPAYDEGQLPKRELGKEIKSSKSRVPQNVVLLSKLNPEIERVWLADALPTEKAICSTEFLVLLARPPFTRSYVYCIARSPLFREQMKSLVTGTSKSHQRSPANAVLSIDTVLPSQEIAEAFELSASRVLRRVLDNRKESRTLATLRDALMPKLVSGEMRICQGHKNRTRKK